MNSFEDQFATYRQQHLGFVDRLIYQEKPEILDLFPESESAAEIVRVLEAFANASGLQRKLTNLVLKNLRAQVGGSTSVIEVCGGSCWLLRNITSQVNQGEFYIHAVGSDISERHIETNKTEFGHMNIEWLIADATDLTFSDLKFDVALNCQALHHFPASTVIRLLQELKRISKKVIIFDLRRTFYGPTLVQFLSPFYSRNFISDGIASHRRAYSIQEMKFIINIADLPYKVTPFTPVGMLVESI